VFEIFKVARIQAIAGPAMSGEKMIFDGLFEVNEEKN
jgi:hypothetical protein